MPPSEGTRSKPRQWKLGAAALLLATLSLLAACTREPTSVRLGYHQFPTYELLAMADDSGYFDDIRLRPVEYASATQNQRAFRNGAVDAAAMTLDEALTVAQEVPDLRIVGILDRSHGGDAVVATHRIHSLTDLRGKRIAVEMTALGAYMLARALDHAGLTSRDIEIVHAQFDSHERLFREGKVDAVVTYEPVRTRLLGLGANVLFDSAAIPGEILDVLVTRGEFADAHPDAIGTLLRGWLRVAKDLETKRSTVIARVAERLGMTLAEVSNAFSLIPVTGSEDNRRGLLPPDRLLEKAVTQLSRTMVEARLLAAPADASALVDGTAVETALKAQDP